MKPLTATCLVIAAAATSSIATYFVVSPASVKAPVQALASSAETTDTMKEMLQLREDLAAAQNRVLELEAAAEATPPAAPAPAAEPAPEPAPVAEPKTPKPSLDQIREAIRKNGGVSAQLQALTELMFAELFADLNLDPEAKAALRQLLLDEQIEETSLAQYAISKGDIPWNQVAKWRSDERAYLDQQVKGILSADAYKKWQDYSATIDDRQVESSLRNQIKAFSSGLTDENFETVMQVAMEEFRTEQSNLDHSNTPFTAAENLNYQIRAMENMRARLEQTLPANQLGEINNWLNMGINLFRNQLTATNSQH